MFGISMECIAWVAVKFGINTTRVVLKMGNFTLLCLVKFVPFPRQHSWKVFISNFTAILMLLHILIVIFYHNEAIHQSTVLYDNYNTTV